jgi:hypothetical protein
MAVDDGPRVQGRFAPGHKPTAHRRKGSRNKTPTEIRQWFFDSAENIGRDGEGTDGGSRASTSTVTFTMCGPR